MFIQAKKKREELRLPILHYNVADDWIDKLGPKTFTAWLKFHTWVNRQDQKIEDISQARVPMSLEKVAEKLGMHKSTMYRTIIPVLWEFGLIDLIEYEDSTRKTQKPINIIPYDYPQNMKELETKPLEKCRDWKKDYNTTASFYGRQGGRSINIVELIDGCENATVDGCENATVDGCENATVTVAETQPINYTNNSINVSNNFLNHDTNTLLIDDEEKDEKLSDYKLLFQYLVKRNVDQLVATEITKMAEQNNIICFGFEVDLQLRDMMISTQVDGKTITNYPTYFLNGIVMQRQQRKHKRNDNKQKKQYEDNLKIQEEHLTPPKKVEFYNWLEERD